MATIYKKGHCRLDTPRKKNIYVWKLLMYMIGSLYLYLKKGFLITSTTKNAMDFN